MLPSLRALVLVIVISTLSSGCGSASAPSLAEQERVRLAELSVRAAPPADAPSPVETPLRLRWNPAPCTCPGWEVLADGEWLRAEVTASGDAAEAVLDAYEDAQDKAVREWAAVGRVRAGKTQSCGAGQSALVVEARWIGQGEPPPPPAP